MKYHIYLLFICSIVIGCVQKPSSTTSTSKFSNIISFTSNDLSEDNQHISTNDDEIFICYGSIYCDQSNNIKNVQLAFHIEEQVIKNTSYKLTVTPDSIPSLENTTAYYFIGLGEYDNETSHSSLTQIRTSFTEALSEKSLAEIRATWDTCLKKNNPYHDNLGIVLQNKNNIKSDFTISGKHLEDSYHYLFKVNFYSSIE